MKIFGRLSLGVQKTVLFESCLVLTLHYQPHSCLNTAIVLMIFAHRRGELHEILNTFKEMEDHRRRDRHRMEDETFIEGMQALGIDHGLVESASKFVLRKESSLKEADAIQNFRELIWFWTEYYTHRGRDRISLEFSSHIRFREWKQVCSLLSADDGSCASLIIKPLRLPRSPYQCAPRVNDAMDSHVRGAQTAD